MSFLDPLRRKKCFCICYNKEMTKQQKIILSSAIISVIIVFVVGLLFQEKSVEEKSEIQKKMQEKISSQTKIETPIQPAFSPNVPKNAVESKPQENAPIAGKENKHGTFDIKVSSNGFDPSSITVKKGDIVSLVFVSVSADTYDFFMPAYGSHITISPKKENRLDFSANDVGTFIFECRDNCPAGKKITGQLIVIPQ